MHGFGIEIKRLSDRIIQCRRCPRLVEYREQVARERRRLYQNWHYWGKPLPGFGDPLGKVLIVGLAPAAHGGNRTGRMFTGDRSGDWLMRTLHRFGFANQPRSIHRGDGLALRNCFITAIIRCAPPKNQPQKEEIENCRPYLAEEIALLKDTRVTVALGQIALHGLLRVLFIEAKPPGEMKFGHGHEYLLPDGKILIASYHPSQQNTQTGRLTGPMFESIFEHVRSHLGSPC
jgi:uracil-DNA glycosylase family 4